MYKWFSKLGLFQDTTLYTLPWEYTKVMQSIYPIAKNTILSHIKSNPILKALVKCLHSESNVLITNEKTIKYK